MPPENSSQNRGNRSRVRIAPYVSWLVLIACSACPTGTGHAEEDLILATVGGHAITAPDVITKAQERHLLRPLPFTDVALVTELVDDVIIDSLISREAPRISLAGEYEFWAHVRRSLTYAAATVYQREVLTPMLAIDSTRVQAYYRSHLGRYMVPHAQRYVRNITIYYPMEKVPKIYASKPDSLYEGWNPQTVIEALYARLADGEDFGDLARAHSEEPKTKGLGGDIGWVSKESLQDDEFGQTCLRIPLYQISKPFRSKIGWHIVQVTGIREPGPAPIEGIVLENIRTSLMDSIGRQLGGRIMDSLTHAGKMVTFDRALELPDSTWHSNTPLAVANDRDTVFAAEYLEGNAHLRAKAKPIPTTLDEKRKLLRGMLPLLCMYRAMCNMGYMDRPEVSKQRDASIRNRVESILLGQMVDAGYVPDSTTVAQYFREHAAEFARPQSYMIHYLRLPVHGQAQAVASKWKAGTTPDSVESRWVEKSDVPASVWNALTQMKEESVSDPLAGDGEYWVAKLLQKSKPPSPAAAFPLIRARLQDDHNRKLRATWIKKTGDRYGIVRYPERNSRVTLPTSKGRKPLDEPDSSAESFPMGG